jgi:epoxyqueuosine reductase
MNVSNEIVIEKAKSFGFDLIGFAPAEELTNEIKKLEEWLSKNFHAGMEYMTRNLEKRKNVKNMLPSARSIISLGMNYYTPEKYSDNKNKGKISRYAWGKDYHLIIWEKLDELVESLQADDPSFEAKTYIDTGPVMDKAWAVKSGIGWLGKHTNVINKEFGSWFFIANIITNFEFKYYIPIEDFCGSCTACIEACPTNAIVDEYILDANKCISYLTIENKKKIPEKFKGKFDNWIFGCDICQDVCPWNNKFSRVTKQTEFFPTNENKEIHINDILSLTKEEFNRRFKDNPVKRAKLSGLKRNAAFLL